jgi:hypothetical protein
VVVFLYQKPTDYAVDSVDNPGELSRAIYNIQGYLYETRTQISGLTPGIHEALKNSKYKGWKITSFKEELASPAWPIAIYRFQVSKDL